MELLVFDFNKIKMIPNDLSGFKPTATDEQIAELEKHCEHSLPESYKMILRHFNGSSPEETGFDVISSEGVPLMWELVQFFYLDAHKKSSGNKTYQNKPILRAEVWTHFY